MRHRVLLLLGVALAACDATDGGGGAGNGGAGGASGFGGLAGAASATLVKEWAKQVALGTEYGGGARVVARFTKAPSLSVMQGSAVDRVHLDALIPVLNQELGEHAIQVVADADDRADIQVHFLPLSGFAGVGQAHGFPVAPGNWGYFYLFWDDDHALSRAFVLLATDQLSGDQLRHFTFEEVTQSLGLASDSSLFPDSIFYANGSDGGSATELSALDRRLLRFVYGRLQPGDDEAAFDQAFEEGF